MLTGLVNTGPTLNVPVQDSKERNTEAQDGKKFSDVLESKAVRVPQKDNVPKRDEVVKTEPEKTPMTPESVDKKSTQRTEEPESQEDSENRTEGPPDPKVMDPRISALRAKRDQAIRKFMDSFEGEFGIPPQEMVEAMSQLTAQDLEQPPEKTADDIISNLHLAKQDETKAKKMYMGLLLQLQQIDTRAALPQPQEDMLSQLSAQRIQLASDKKTVMAGQVQNLNDKFWMKGAYAEKAMTPQMDQLQAREFLKKMITAESVGLEEQLAADPEVMASTENILKQLKAENLELLQQPEEEGQTPVKQEIPFMPQVQQIKPMSHQNQQQDMNQEQTGQENMAQQQVFAGTMKKPVTQEEVAAEFKKMGIKVPEQTKKVAQTEVQSLLSLDPSALSQLKPDQLASILPAVALQPTVDMSPVQKTENIQQIMNQAQILLKNGGGEVKVEMSPEGMGTVQMKLQVLDGKVQLQMNTETKEAKKMIESSMHDLKQSLAAHQLSMDLVKVDVVNQTNSSQNTQNDLQNQMQNFLNQQQRDGTKQFWQQFNENFGNRQARENFYDAQTLRSPVKNQTLPGFDGTVSSNGRAQSDGRGKSINLVA